jgi:hypothetical protein
MVEMLSCIKDWEAGHARVQHAVEDKDLFEASFDELAVCWRVKFVSVCIMYLCCGRVKQLKHFRY